MAEFTHRETGVRVSVADGKQLGPEWVPVVPDAPKRVKKTGPKGS